MKTCFFKYLPGRRVAGVGMGGLEIDLGNKPELVEGLTAVDELAVELELDAEDVDAKLFEKYNIFFMHNYCSRGGFNGYIIYKASDTSDVKLKIFSVKSI